MLEVQAMAQPRRKPGREAEIRRLVNGQLPDLIEWMIGQSKGYSAISMMERIYRDPGRSTKLEHRALHGWPPRRLQVINRAFESLPRLSRAALMFKYGLLRLDDGAPITDNDRADAMGLTVRDWDVLIARSRDLLCDAFRRIDKAAGKT